jgi:maltose O-acetyltransferase
LAVVFILNRISGVSLDGNLITIGDNVLLGPRVGLYTANHALDPQERLMGGCYAHPIVIEDNVWVGAGVHIMGGVTVGRNSVIGAGSVVTKSIPENVIAEYSFPYFSEVLAYTA